MRGEIWTICASGYASKPRPCVIIQSDSVTAYKSTIVCLLTSRNAIGDASIMRVPLKAAEQTGLDGDCFIMCEKLMAVEAAKLGKKIGTVDATTMEKVSEKLRLLLALA